jgi:hypothetical protein
MFYKIFNTIVNCNIGYLKHATVSIVQYVHVLSTTPTYFSSMYTFARVILCDNKTTIIKMIGVYRLYPKYNFTRASIAALFVGARMYINAF